MRKFQLACFILFSRGCRFFSTRNERCSVTWRPVSGSGFTLVQDIFCAPQIPRQQFVLCTDISKPRECWVRRRLSDFPERKTFAIFSDTGTRPTSILFLTTCVRIHIYTHTYDSWYPPGTTFAFSLELFSHQD